MHIFIDSHSTAYEVGIDVLEGFYKTTIFFRVRILLITRVEVSAFNICG